MPSVEKALRDARVRTSVAGRILTVHARAGHSRLLPQHAALFVHATGIQETDVAAAAALYIAQFGQKH